MTNPTAFESFLAYFGWIIGIVSVFGLMFSLYFAHGPLSFMETWKNSERYTKLVSHVGGQATFYLLILLTFWLDFHWLVMVSISGVLGFRVGAFCKVNPATWRLMYAFATFPVPPGQTWDTFHDNGGRWKTPRSTSGRKRARW